MSSTSTINPISALNLGQLWQSQRVLLLLLFWALLLKTGNFIGLAEGDDLYYTQLADRAANGDFKAYFIFDVRWLVYLPTAALYWLIGTNDITSLFMPMLASMFSVFFAFKIVEQLLDQKTAVFTTLIYSSAPVVLTYANVLQVAPVLECCTLGCVFFLLRGLQSNKLSDFLLCGLFIGLVAMTRITGLFIAAIITVMLLSMRGFSIRNILILSAMAAVSLLPLIVQGLVYWQVHGDFLHRVAQSQSVVQFQANLKGVDPKDLFFYVRTLFLKEGFANWTYFGLLGYLGVPAALAAIWVGIASKRPAAIFFALWFLGYFLLMTFTPTSTEPYTTLIRNIRYAIVFVLPLSACLAWAIVNLPTDKLSANKALILQSSIVAIVVAVHLYLTMINSERYHNRRDIQKTASERVVELVGDSKIFLADRNIDRRLAYYSGYKFKNGEHYRKVRKLSQINEPGYFIMLKKGYNRQRYLMEPKMLDMIRKNPERYGMRYIDDYRYFWVFEIVRPFGRPITKGPSSGRRG